jgi:hypothetical protein
MPQNARHIFLSIGASVVLFATGCAETDPVLPGGKIGLDWSHSTNGYAAQFFETNASLRTQLMREPELRNLRNRFKRVTIEDHSYYVAEGDLLLDESQFLIYAHDRLVASNKMSRRFPSMFGPGGEAWFKPFSVGIEIDGMKVRWADPHLTYCVRSNSFETAAHYQTVITNLYLAGKAWSDAGNVSFRHVPEKDVGVMPIDSTTGAPIGVSFIVLGCNNGGTFIAAAFFPTDGGSRRRLYVDRSYFAPGTKYDPVGVMRHELGHILGLVHEHIRIGVPRDCPSDMAMTGTPVNLTVYDPKSVMHYFCDGVGSTEMKLTEKDSIGIQMLYGAPPAAIAMVR